MTSHIALKFDILTRASLIAESQKQLDKLTADLHRLEQDYARTHHCECTFTYPIRASLPYHVRQMELDP